jgi:sugar/nucleoside kinase (ribokinase family)
LSIVEIRGVACCGNLSYDIPVWPVERFAWGATTWVEEITWCPGGNGGNTSYALATLGTSVILFSAVSSDEMGDRLLAELRRFGVDVSFVRRSALPTNSSVCIVHPSGDRGFLHRVGASADIRAEMVDFDRLPAQVSHFHLANPFALPDIRRSGARLLQTARGRGFTTSLDAGWDARGEWLKVIEPMLPWVDLFFLNESEMLHLTGHDEPQAAARFLRERGARDLVFKLGARGCVLLVDGEWLAESAFDVQVVDTTGAGDCFVGGFLAALAHGMSYAQAAVVANAAGARNASHLGATRGMLDWPTTLAWMQQTPRRAI